MDLSLPSNVAMVHILLISLSGCPVSTNITGLFLIPPFGSFAIVRPGSTPLEFMIWIYLCWFEIEISMTGLSN